MSVSEPATLDGFAIGNNGEAVLMLFDHLPWDNEGEHLMILQEKINSYIAYIETKQYEKQAPGQVIDRFIIDVSFLHGVTDNASAFLQHVATQIEPLNITLQINSPS